MGRIVAGVILGYVLIVMLVFAALGGAWTLLGADGAFARPGSWETSGTWIAVMLVVGAIAAVLGGLAARRIGRSVFAPASLAGVVLLLGVLAGVMQVMANRAPNDGPEPEPRPEQVTMTEAMNGARPPTWFQFANTVVGAAGVLMGGLLLASGARDASGPAQGAEDTGDAGS